VAAIVAARPGLHRPVEVADHILEQGEPRRVPWRQPANRETRPHLRLAHAVPLGDIVNILDEKGITTRRDFAAPVDIIDRGQSRPKTHRRQLVEQTISGIFQQRILIEVGTASAMGDQLELALARKDGRRGWRTGKSHPQWRELANILLPSRDPARLQLNRQRRDPVTNRALDRRSILGLRPGQRVEVAGQRQPDHLIGCKQRRRCQGCLLGRQRCRERRQGCQ
jgi:hypothetical protein